MDQTMELLLGMGARKQAEKEIKLLKLSEELGKDVIFKICSLPYNTVARLREKKSRVNSPCTLSWRVLCIQTCAAKN